VIPFIKARAKTFGDAMQTLHVVAETDEPLPGA
jgi:hypothetical protein